MRTVGEGRTPVVVVVAALVLALAGAGTFLWIERDGEDAPVDVAARSLERGVGALALPSPVPQVALQAPPPEPVPQPTATTDDGLPVVLAGPAPSPTTVADAVGAKVPVFAAPGDAEPGLWLDNPTWEDLDVVFLVHERRGEWLRVQLAMRPNGATAWVRASDVTLRPVAHRVVVDASTLTMRLYDGGQVVFEAPVAVGKGSTPTPRGYFFVDGIVALGDTTGPYGSHQVSVTGYSEVYRTFGGGIGQIALHGTNQPDLLGSPVSNGCVRMRNADIARLASLVPTGTPVEIVG